MTRLLFSAPAAMVPLMLAGVLAAAPPAPAPRSKEPAKPKAAEMVVAPSPRAQIKVPIADSIEVIVYTPSRPVRALVHVDTSGKSLGDLWVETLRQSFEFFDRDKDGFLNEAETSNIFSDLGLSMMLQNGFYQPTPQDRPTLARLDANGDGKVSFEEYVAYYTVSSSFLLRATPPQPDNPGAAATTEALFKLLDTNSDGKLTRDELRAAEKLIPQLDADEDECLSTAEIMPNQNRGRGVRLVVPGGQMRQAPPVASQPVATYQPGRIPGTIIQHIIKKYDKDGDFALTREECAFDEPTFRRLDRNGDGKLDGEELDAWRLGPPDFEVSLSFALKPGGCTAKLLTDSHELEARGFSPNQQGSRKLVIRCGRHPIEFIAATSPVQYRQVQNKNQFSYLFAQAAGKKGYVEDKDLAGPAAVQFQLLRVIFDAADANGDGKLTKPEFDAFFDMQDAFRAVSLTVAPSVQTPTLFQLIDENRDGRLSVRELRTAWDRLIVLEPPGAEAVTRAAIQPTVSIRLMQSADRFGAGEIVVVDNDFGFNNNQVPVPQKGPLWFRKMDRNGDGDVSRSEFLGTAEEFDLIDADHDGLISLEEAEAWDKKMREAAEKKAGVGEKSKESPPAKSEPK